MDTSPARERDIRALLGKLDLRQKVRLLTGADFWRTHAEPAIGLRAMVLSDGPAGVRGRSFDERDPSLSLPSGTALGATWDTALARRYGAALGAEARRQGVDVVLGPTINLQRTPLGGRHFEAFAEDPLLTAELATAYVEGVQAAGAAATPKHFVANDAETDRFTVDNRIDERALREVHLAAFEAVVVRARAWLVMSAYNSVNGTTMSEHELLRDPLSRDWGFDGVVVSDWTAVRSTVAAANAAQDLVMPGPEGPWGQRLVDAVRAGEVPEAAVDEKVLRLLRLAARVGALDTLPPAVPVPPPAEDGAALAREVAAGGMVLARNDGSLPWSPERLGSVAVLGQNAVRARTQGGGSATVRPREVISPLAGLRAALGAEVVRYRLGATVTEGVLAFDPAELTNPVTGRAGVRVRFLAEDGAELGSEDRLAAALVWLDDLPAGTHTIELRTVWDAPAGTHHVGASALGGLVLTVDGAEVLDAVTDADGDLLGAAFLAPPAVTAAVGFAGGAAEIVVRYTSGAGPDLPLRAVTFGTATVPADADAEIAAAAALAAGSDVALVVVGTGETIESEGFDRTSLALPGRQDDLVRAVAAANPRTVVLVNSGAPVLLPWRDEVAAVLFGWFGGERFGEAVADVLLGVREPGGRLPASWPATGDERSVLSGVPADGVVPYAEGVHIGHRGWLRNGDRPAYPFGHGLGYTSWELRGARAPGQVTEGEPVPIAVELANTGARPGRQVVQVYLSRPHSALDRPARWLAGWALVDAPPGPATATVTLPPRAFQHWEDGAWRTEPGPFTVHIGTSATDTPLATRVTVR
ncbi:glycoside hydrolase family 3 C-terminal domain-containing protein [Amycolatopsis sp. OK19-0408]|uniref:Glycoside hydrolase family 3 C-terminal domain-containing protein n=1 Tax=Amycolatopsis iheyensis TaxID=2945988 RepID=A0A9X2NGN6_9PSEU|nr:glycoside hydrolase family 3 C-terminal domain-containing protein [Amycolatopsis iheyensis]MCR6488461.1 glycoside hydrolase family 3 C-terminal domain-containing protein [Amycolatopsis iheyensis]